MTGDEQTRRPVAVLAAMAQLIASIPADEYTSIKEDASRFNKLASSISNDASESERDVAEMSELLTGLTTQQVEEVQRVLQAQKAQQAQQAKQVQHPEQQAQQVQQHDPSGRKRKLEPQSSEDFRVAWTLQVRGMPDLNGSGYSK